MNTLFDIGLFFIGIAVCEYLKVDVPRFMASVLFLMNCYIIRKIDKIHEGER